MMKLVNGGESLDKNQGDFFTVGKLAKRCGVTVRTLQYYDTNGLLVPSEYSEGGRRMYGRKDIILLQQILFLKSFGFSLEEIRDKLLLVEDTENLKQMIKNQKEVLARQIEHIQKSMDLMDNAIAELEVGSEIDVEILFALVGSIQMGNPYGFMIRNFSKEQIENFFTTFENQEAAIEASKDIQELFTRLIELHQGNKDPQGVEGQKLAARWWDFVMLFTKGDPKLIKNMFAVGANEDNWPTDTKALKEATKLFLGTAISTYLKNNNIKLNFMEGK